jgi:hypothetical protein
LLGNGDLKKKLTVRVHAISATAREKVEKAGGTVSLLKEPKVKKRRHKKPKAATPEPKAKAPETQAAETPPAAAEPEPVQADEPAAPEEG